MAEIQRIENAIDKEVAGAIATVGGMQGALAIAPRNIGEMMEFAKMMAVSGFCVRPQFRGNPGACLAIAMQAFKWGADPFAVSNKAYVTKNKAGEEQVAYEAQLVHAIVNTCGPLTKRLRPFYSGEGLNRRCKIVGYIKDEDEPFEYESPTIKEIEVKNSPLWRADPDQQLFYYSVRAWARRHLPETLLGIYTRDEIEQGIDLGDPSDRAQNITPETARPRRDFDEQPAEPVVVAYEVIDHTGEATMVPGHDQAAQAFREALDAALREGVKGVLTVWENSAGLMDELETNGHGDLTRLLSKYYAEIRERAGPAEPAPREPGDDDEPVVSERENPAPEPDNSTPRGVQSAAQPSRQAPLPTTAIGARQSTLLPDPRPTIFDESSWAVEIAMQPNGKPNWAVMRDQLSNLVGHCQSPGEVDKLLADNAALLADFKTTAPVFYATVLKNEQAKRAALGG